MRQIIYTLIGCVIVLLFSAVLYVMLHFFATLFGILLCIFLLCIGGYIIGTAIMDKIDGKW